jgi:hypothetical protein
MSGLGRKVWEPLDVLAAADLNGYLMDQSVMVFPDAATRLSEIPLPSEGMVTYLTTLNSLEVFDGSQWVGTNSVGGNVLGSQVTGTITTATLPGSQVTGNITTATIPAANVTTTQVNSAATSYAFATSDAAKLIRFTSASTVVATVGTATALSAGQSIDVLRDGAGVVRIAAGAGVGFGGAGTAGTAYTIDQFEVATIYCVAANTYRIIGNVTAV